jgi:hypothetical protein
LWTPLSSPIQEEIPSNLPPLQISPSPFCSASKKAKIRKHRTEKQETTHNNNRNLERKWDQWIRVFYSLIYKAHVIQLGKSHYQQHSLTSQQSRHHFVKHVVCSVELPPQSHPRRRLYGFRRYGDRGIGTGQEMGRW